MSALARALRNLPNAGSATEWHFAELVIAAESALQGGRAAMPFYMQSELDVEGPPGSPVTNADRASHHAIKTYLETHRPDEAILSEEGDHPSAASSGSQMWIVDPLDGTREFIDQIGEFSVMVGLVEDGRPVLGAVYRPDPDVIYLGLIDGGAWRLENASSEPSVSVLAVDGHSSQDLRFVRSRSHPDDRLRELERAISPTEVLVSGSVGTKCALIAEGRADVYVHPVPYLKEWDTCAPEAVLRGAGGCVTDCRGDALLYGKVKPIQPRGIFAAHSDAWHRVSEIVFNNGKDL